jgi:hypothetical protein
MKHAASRLLTRQDLFDWTRLDSAGVYAFQHAAIIDKPNNLCRVFMNQTGLDWTRLDSVGGYAPQHCEADEITMFITVQGMSLAQTLYLPLISDSISQYVSALPLSYFIHDICQML